MLPNATTPFKKNQKNINLQLILKSGDSGIIKCSFFCIYSDPFVPFAEGNYKGLYYDALAIVDNRDMQAVADIGGYPVSPANYESFVDEDGVTWDVKGYAMYTYYDETKHPDDWKYFLEKNTDGWTFHLRKNTQQ